MFLKAHVIWMDSKEKELPVDFSDARVAISEKKPVYLFNPAHVSRVLEHAGHAVIHQYDMVFVVDESLEDILEMLSDEVVSPR